MHKSSISSVEIATGMFMLLFNSLFLPMFCYLPFILRYFICVYFMSFHFPFMRVTSMSFHYLFISISFHCPCMPSKSSQIEYSECMTLATMVVTIYMCEYWKKHIYTHTKAFSFVFTFLSCLSFSCQFPASFLSLPSMFLLFPSIISLFYVHLI